MKFIDIFSDFDGVSCVVSSLKSDDIFCVFGVIVYYFSFSFISPLGSDYDIYRHCYSLFVLRILHGKPVHKGDDMSVFVFVGWGAGYAKILYKGGCVSGCCHGR